MKKLNILYWTFTGLFAAVMLFSAIPDILNQPEAVDFMTNRLGYPLYFTPFIGWAKVLGVIAILIPGFPRIKEWAYAGLFFDLIGATYSNMMIDGIKPEMLGMIIFFGPAICSYVFYHKRLKAKNNIA